MAVSIEYQTDPNMKSFRALGSLLIRQLFPLGKTFHIPGAIFSIVFFPAPPCFVIKISLSKNETHCPKDQGRDIAN